ncbi:MAG: mismatch-specific DNA-glycosylase, partial [Pseudomonadota bacterium]
SGADRALSRTADDAAALARKIRRFRPGVLAFNGKRAAAAFLGRPVDYGRQPETIGPTAIFVLPSTSGAARGFWDERVWRNLAAFVSEP